MAPKKFFDQTQDDGSHSREIISTYGLERCVEGFTDQELGIGRGPNAIKSAYYGHFPTDSRGAVVLSYAMLRGVEHNASQREVDAAAASLTKSAERFRCTAALAAIDEQVNKMRKTASADPPDDDFAFVSDDEPRIRKLRISSPDDGVDACDYLVAHRGAFSFEDRQKMAERIVRRAAERGWDLGQNDAAVHSMAGFGACDHKTATAALQTRLNVLAFKSPAGCKVAQDLEPISRILNGTSKLDHLHWCKIAQAVALADEVSGLNKDYAKGVPAPEEIFFGIVANDMVKFANDHVWMSDGRILALDDVERLIPQQVRDRLGDEVADALTNDGLWIDREKASCALPLLSRDDAVCLRRLLAQAPTKI